MPSSLETRELVLTINGAKTHVTASGEESLLSVLRNRLNLTGTKYGCGEGECGACTVLLDGKAVRSCPRPSRTPSEQRSPPSKASSRTESSLRCNRPSWTKAPIQCGYCTSGMILQATALLHDLPAPTEKQIISRMNGNVCRCGTYPRIVVAVQRASHSMAKGGAR